MSGLTLTLTHPLAAAADLSALLAPGWQALEAAAMAQRAIRVGRDTVAVGALFSVVGSAGPDLTLQGDLARASGIASDLDAGNITVEGDVGDDAGLGMRGGVLSVRGSAGHNLGGARPGAKRGMTGGEIIVHGDVGNEAGTAVRRGTIAIGGKAGARTARGGIAGTVYIAGDVGADTGVFLKRASVIVGGSAQVPAGFREACRYDPAYVRLLQRRLIALGFPLPPAQLGGTWRRFSGDAGEGALGELLLWAT